MRFILLLLTLTLSFPSIAKDFAQLEKQIAEQIRQSGFIVGVSARHLKSGPAISVNGDLRLPMTSVYKFPIGLVLLKQVEEGTLKFDQLVRVTAADIRGGYKGPVARQYPQGGVSLPLTKLFEYMISSSDNSSSDLILKLIGGPKQATAQLRKWDLQNISIDRFEKELIVDNNNPRKLNLDTASADELVRLSTKFSAGELLSAKNTELLKKWMSTPGHVEKSLPPGTSVYHKSGWCGGTKCINDVAVFSLPNEEGQVALAILVSGEIKDSQAVSQLIGKISRMVFHFYSN